MSGGGERKELPAPSLLFNKYRGADGIPRQVVEISKQRLKGRRDTQTKVVI